MIDVPQRATMSAQQVARIHVLTPAQQIMPEMQSALRELESALHNQSTPPTGPWFTHHLRRPTDTFDFYACFPVAREIDPAGRVEFATIPAANVIRTVYRGAYQDLPHAWQELIDWIEKDRVALRGDFFEVYTINPQDNPDPAAWSTELNCPFLSGSESAA